MTTPLFRQEVWDRQEERHWGASSGLNPVSVSVLGWLLLGLAVASGAALVTGNYQRKAVVSGVLVADRGMLQVRAPAEGMIKEVAAGTGERVGNGEFLLKLQSGINRIDGEAVAGKLLAENQQQMVLLESLVEEHDNEYALRRSEVVAEKTNLAERSTQLEAVIANESSVYALMENQYRRMQALAAGSHIAAGDVEQARIELLRQQGVLMQSRLELADARQALDQTGRDAALLEHEYHRGRNELKRRLSELRGQNVRLQSEQMLEVVSPVTGTVAVSLVTPGQSVVAGQPLLIVAAEGSVPEAELHVPSRAIGFLQEGQAVNLRIDAFPYQKFGVVTARIREISGSVVATDSSREGVGTEPYYKVSAELKQYALQAFDTGFPLRAGMQFQADIVLESRSLLEWLLEPLYISGRLHGGR